MLMEHFPLYAVYVISNKAIVVADFLKLKLRIGFFHHFSSQDLVTYKHGQFFYASYYDPFNRNRILIQMVTTY